MISRALVEIFRVPHLAQRLAFRGGTALFKLHLTPAARYSEDIDLVQIAPEPIGETLDAVRAVLDPWLGEPRVAHRQAPGLPLEAAGEGDLSSAHAASGSGLPMLASSHAAASSGTFRHFGSSRS